MKNSLYLLFVLFVVISSCKKKVLLPVEQALSTDGIAAVGPYFTTDQKGNKVLCWSKQGNDSLYRLKYAVYDEQEDKFSTAATVPASAGSSTSPESMGKIAFKADGTVMAIFAKRFPKEKNPYAGAIYYSSSTDHGKSWSAATFLHSDTSHAFGRSFFDIAKLKDGELAAVWLDGRFGKTIKGSALFLSKTEKGKGFGKDTCLDKGTCECCRTAILTDGTGNIHLAYRSIMFPSTLADRQVRDMVYKVSADNGQTFSTSRIISKDNWEIDGCPHSGPTLAVVKNTVHVTWFTAGGSAGLYSTTATLGKDFHTRDLVTASGRHPQMVALKHGGTAMVCEEMPENSHVQEASMNMDHSMKTDPGATKIILRMFTGGGRSQQLTVTDGSLADNHAVLTPLDNDLLIAWVREGKSGSKLYYAKVKTTE